MIKIAMVRVHDLLEEGNYETRMLLQVHDELVFDLHRDEEAEVVPKIVEAMKTRFLSMCRSWWIPGQVKTGSTRIDSLI